MATQNRIYGVAKVELATVNTAQTATEGWTTIGDLALDSVSLKQDPKELVSEFVEDSEQAIYVREGEPKDLNVAFTTKNVSLDNLEAAYGGTQAAGVYTSPTTGSVIEKAVKITDKLGNVLYLANVKFANGIDMTFAKGALATVPFTGKAVGGFVYTPATIA